jgi:tRNA threonylcarbamoyladenosine modification (KEOPS) complex  Pcc1 subunit
MYKSVIEISGKQIDLDSYYNALIPEQDFKSERASYKLKKSKDKLTITIEAEDATSFRAVINTIAGLIAVVQSSIEAVDKRA